MTPIPISHNSVAATELFRKNGDVTRGKLSLQHVPTTCPRNMSPTSSCKNLEKFHRFSPVFHQLRWNTFAPPPLPPNQCCIEFRDVNQSNKEQH